MYKDCEVVKLRKGNVAYVKDGELVARSCTGCGELKDSDEFRIHKKRIGGKSPSCKICENAAMREYRKDNYKKLQEQRRNRREANPEKERERSRKWREDNPEASREAQRKWRDNNRDKISQRDKEYRESNRERVIEYNRKWNLENKEYARAWYRNNREKASATRQRRRALLANLPSDFSESNTQDLIAKFGGGCALTGSAEYHLDHVIPIATGHGGTIVGNMVPLRGDLNISKNAKNVFVWFNEVREREHLEQERFNAMITYLAEQNGMTVFEYTAYVYECHTKEE